ncbi:hypothetical protein KP509_11G056900 [Ceratopteris richardii]|uniref:non-specific serine/threonine protein kinase n=3 Tax=Ceratopteris richardii TaxID=49495 RepID=A0A8T2TQ36_CERRI|nr:hypothetical protein KP509_11G056900 [Ceratopteris richardii]
MRAKGTDRMGFDALRDIERRTNGLGVLCFCWPGSAKIQNSAAIDGSDCGKAGHGTETTTKAPCEQVIQSTDKTNDLHGLLTSDEQVLMPSPQLRQFRYDDLKTATRNFRPDSLLGEGGFGYVFKGWIDEHGTAPMKPGTGLTVAVKTLNKSGLQGHKEWLAEINFLGQFHHPNLVKLIGFCIEEEQRLLVYEFMERGSLENHLFRKGSVALPWNARMKIALAAAKGLDFLHSGGPNGSKPVIYRDLKASNILLGQDYTAKLSDFGLAKDGPEGDKSHVSTRVMGTYGYAAPEYVLTGHLTTMSDVYSFGVVLLEILSGKRAMDKTRPVGQHNLVEWCRPYLSDGNKLFKVMDTRLDGQYSIKGSQTAGKLAHRCLNRDPKRRPKMAEIVDILEQIQNLKDMAKPST